MTLIDGDRIVTVQLYDDEHEEFKEEKIAYTDEGVTTADDVLDKIREEIEQKTKEPYYQHEDEDWSVGLEMALEIIDKYRGE